MLRVVWRQVTQRRGRSVAVVSAILVAAVSFSLLTSAVATSKLQVRGTVDENFRTAYDILVRPSGSRTALEVADGLVQENYLSGIFGGITMDQYRRIASLSGVEVAAPVAMVGYVLPALYVSIRIDEFVTPANQQLWVVSRSRQSDRGLSAYPDPDSYIYLTRRRVTYQDGEYGPTQRDPLTGKPVNACQSFLDEAGPRSRRSTCKRVRLVTEQIARQTGLDVDITIGSSPTPEFITLPGGEYGRPELTLREGWVSKGVTVELLSAIDRKSLVMFMLVLLTCLLFLFNATVAAVRTRRAELGVLACLGWPARRIFALLLAELVTTGLAAGVLGTIISAVLVTVLDLQVPWLQLALITPVATLLASLAGVGPAWTASSANPREAMQPSVRAPRRATNVRSVGRLALVGVGRWPGRTLLGAASLFVGVAALTGLVAVQAAFRGGVAGTLLRDVVAVQVRGVDYLAAALTIALGAFAVADIAYLNISERTNEIGTLRATGWGEQHLRRLFGTVALLTAAIGAGLGAATAVTAVTMLLPVPWATALAAAAAATGLTAAAIALLVPLTSLNRLAPAAAIANG